MEDVRHKKKSQESTIEALLSLNLLTDETIAQTLAENAGMDYVDLKRLDVNPAVAARLAPDAAVRFRVVPIAEGGGSLVIAVTDPLDFDALDSLRHVLTVEPEFVVASDSAIKQRQLDFYASQLDSDQIAKLDSQAIAVTEGAAGEGGDAPIIKMVYQILQEAYQNRASDIHIEPTENDMRVRYRIDGALHKVQSHPLRLLASVISRIKIMTGSMAISEKRLPQDGRIQAKFGAGDLDLRVSTVPTPKGEKTVMRILDSRSISVGLNDLGFSDDALTIWKKQIEQPHGILLVTGPTGSGKTTTLYSSIRQMDTRRMNISTVEDPIEYNLQGITQIQTHEKIGMTFAKALKALLRQDPDVVMLGEIRDQETASTAIQAALTGHLVLSTLHTNDMRDFLLTHGIDSPTMRVGAGCPSCRQTGYNGRLGLYELLVLDDFLRDKIASNPNVVEFRRLCVERGMSTLREDGFAKVRAGRTTVEEVLAVTEATI